MRLLIFSIFFLSGMTGLIYEIVWTKMLSLTIGSTVWSLTTVLVAFMGGLALGSYTAGRLGKKIRRPLLVYGILEGIIGLYALCIPWMIEATEPIFSILYNNYFENSFYIFSIYRFAVCTIILIVPTTFMGATLPLLSKHMVSASSKVGSGVGALFAINTLGAVTGSLISGFYLLPTYGQWRSIVIAASINIAIAVIVIVALKLFGKPDKQTEKAEVPEVSSSESIDETTSAQPDIKGKLTATAIICLLAYAASGFAAMVYQIAWTRALALCLGSSVYAFSLIVSSFILGLALGSAIASRIVERFKSKVFAFGVVELLIAFTGVAVIPIIGKMPLIMVSLLVKYSGNYSRLLLVEFGLVFVILLGPTLFMGACFPLACSIFAKERGGVARSVGGIYSANTIGAILGSFAGGFAFMVWFGMEKSIYIASGINIVAATVLITFSLNRKLLFRGLTAATILVASWGAMNLVPEWDYLLMSSGPMVYGETYARDSKNQKKTLEEIIKKDKILNFWEGPNTYISVGQNPEGIIYLRVNGKTDASTGTDMSTQILSGQIPMLLHENPKDVLVIGLASGVSLGAVTLHPVNKVVCLEIAKYMKEAYKYFIPVNHDPLSDPRVKLIIGDGRNHLKLSNDTYDVIISEPSNPWIAGVSTLFTKEFFELAKSKLNPNGIMLIWMQAYHMSGEDFQLIVNTMKDVYPSLTIWESLRGGDYLLVAKKPPGRLTIDLELMKRKLEDPRIKADLERTGTSTISQILSRFVMGQEGLSMISPSPMLHTDDRLSLEYNAPTNLYKDDFINIYRNVLRHIEKPNKYIVNASLEVELMTDLDRLSEAHKLSQKGFLEQVAGRYLNAVEWYNQALAINPTDVMALHESTRIYYTGSLKLSTMGDYPKALEFLQNANVNNPGNPVIIAQMGVVYYDMGLIPQAKSKFIEALGINESLDNAQYYMGLILKNEGKQEEALEHFEKTIELNPWARGAIVSKAQILYGWGKKDQAINVLKEAIRFDKENAVAYLELGNIFKKDPDTFEQGEKYINKAYEIEPDLRSVFK